MCDFGRCRLQARRHFLQQHVADAMTERVVDHLEAVDVEKHDGEIGPIVAGARGGVMTAKVVERGAENAPVRKPGQRILGRQPGDVGLGLAPFGLARQNSLHRGEYDQRQNDARQDVQLEISP